MINSRLQFTPELKLIVTNLIGFSFFLLSVQIHAQDFIPGNSYFDNNGYVEYLAGNLPIVISAPHGGYLEPESIPDRDCSGCSYIRDSYTQELAREVQNAFFETTGCYPHVVINLLHRKKFDANRDIGDAADGNATVEQSWYAYHEFLDSAKASIVQDYSRGIFYDLHGHGHTIQRIELGYLLSRIELQRSDNELNTSSYTEQSAIQTLAHDNLGGHLHAELLRGNTSFGTMLEDRGYRAVPSTPDPYPLSNESYFSGGYNTLRHGALEGGPIDGIQIECNQSIRFEESARQEFADSLAQAMINYTNTHYINQFSTDFCSALTNNENTRTIDQIEVFPNPATTEFSIKGPYEELEIRVLNSLGQEILLLNWNGRPMDVSRLPSGLYILQFEKNSLPVGTYTLIVR